MKRPIDVIEHASQILSAVKNGVLVTTKQGDRVNSMTISWGSLGIEWGKPLFITYVRDSRFTKEFLDATGEFTVSLPIGTFDRNITAVCGSKSGRDTDKVAELSLALEDPQVVSAPGVRELPLTLECRVLYKREQDPSRLPQSEVERWYPANDAGVRDVHTAYYAEIVAAYVIEKNLDEFKNAK